MTDTADISAALATDHSMCFGVAVEMSIGVGTGLRPLSGGRPPCMKTDDRQLDSVDHESREVGDGGTDIRIGRIGHQQRFGYSEGLPTFCHRWLTT